MRKAHSHKRLVQKERLASHPVEMCSQVMYSLFMNTLHRTQVLLAPKNVRYISARASQQSLSMSEVIRQILDDAEAREPVAIESVWTMVGIGAEEPGFIGGVAVSENTDLYLVEATAPKPVRKSSTPRKSKPRS